MSTEKGGIHIVQPMVSKKEGLDYTPNATKLQTVSPKTRTVPTRATEWGESQSPSGLKISFEIYTTLRTS